MATPEGRAISLLHHPAGHYLIFWEVLTDKDGTGDLKPLDPVFAAGMEWLVAAIRMPKDVKEDVREMLSAQRRGA